MAVKPISVSQLNGYIKRVLISDPLLGNLTVKGEISNYKLHSSGHVYFSLKDGESKINCFLPRDVFENLGFELEDGLGVIAYGYIGLYERGGSYSLNIKDMEIEGVGNLSIAFEKLKKKLEAEGLFNKEHKKKLPFFPKNVGVVTSATGAAVEDIIQIIKGKNSHANIMVFSTLVQGPEAAKNISETIDYINKEHKEIDVLIVGRGGGSIEELWPFNEEIVARSIFNSKIPIISAVGHQTDVTISDFVADFRAETPTAAANMAVPDINELRMNLDYMSDDLSKGMENIVARLEYKLLLKNLDNFRHSINNHIENSLNNLNRINSDNKNDIQNVVSEKYRGIEINKALLESLNPLNLFERGYGLIQDNSGNTIKDFKNININDEIFFRNKEEKLLAKVLDKVKLDEE